MATIKISTGLKVYDIEDEKGNIRGQIAFNPKDMNFFKRASEFQDRVTSKIEELSKLTINTEQEFIDALDKADALIKSEINVLFDDENTSNVVFGNQNAFNTLDGVTFIERFLQAFMPIIKKEFEKEVKASKVRISKYLEDK